jgi:hypothetical protein
MVASRPSNPCRPRLHPDFTYQYDSDGSLTRHTRSEIQDPMQAALELWIDQLTEASIAEIFPHGEPEWAFRATASDEAQARMHRLRLPPPESARP